VTLPLLSVARDDYLHSQLTDRNYEAGSKRRLQGWGLTSAGEQLDLDPQPQWEPRSSHAPSGGRRATGNRGSSR
jgi:hypothetical protein